MAFGAGELLSLWWWQEFFISLNGRIKEGGYMKDQKFTIYEETGVYLGGEIKDGCLELLSEVYGEWDSEQHYSFSKEDTEKLFSLISLENFIVFCREKNLLELDEFFKEHDIHPGVFTI